jgi:acetyl-CoA carboxylase alpha subunit
MTTILDNQRKALETRIEWLQNDIKTLQASLQNEIETLRAKLQKKIYKLQNKRQKEIDELQATLARRKGERRELDDYVPAVDPDFDEDAGDEAII